MTDEELIKVLKELETVRVEKLNDNSKRLFYAIMKIADERDNLKEKNQRLNNEIKVLLKENEAKEKVIIKQDNVLNELENFILNHYVVGDRVQNYSLDCILKKLKELKESDK